MGIKDLWWIFIEIRIPVKEIRRLIENDLRRRELEREISRREYLDKITH